MTDVLLPPSGFGPGTVEFSAVYPLRPCSSLSSRTRKDCRPIWSFLEPRTYTPFWATPAAGRSGCARMTY